MKRKLITLLLATCFALGITGCGEDEDLTPFADVDYEEFDEDPDADNKSPWGEGRK